MLSSLSLRPLTYSSLCVTVGMSILRSGLEERLAAQVDVLVVLADLADRHAGSLHGGLEVGHRRVPLGLRLGVPLDCETGVGGLELAAGAVQPVERGPQVGVD